MNCKLIGAVLAACSITLLAGCAQSVLPAESPIMPIAGFWHGLWHGVILPVSWFVSMFDPDVAIYATYNNGAWYDFGFVAGVGALGGSSSGKK